MPLAPYVSIENLLPLCIIILAAALLMHVLRTRRKLDALDVDGLKRRLLDLEKKAVEQEGALEESRRNLADVTITTRALGQDLKEVQEESSRFLTIFKTVLYGFDYIVQGCKNALEIGPSEKRPEEKRITPE